MKSHTTKIQELTQKLQVKQQMRNLLSDEIEQLNNEIHLNRQEQYKMKYEVNDE